LSRVNGTCSHGTDNQARTSCELNSQKGKRAATQCVHVLSCCVLIPTILRKFTGLVLNRLSRKKKAYDRVTKHLSFALPSLPCQLPALVATFTRLSSHRICQTKTIPRQAKTALVYTHQSCFPLHTPETVIRVRPIRPNPFSLFIHPSIKSAISMIPPRISTCHTIRLPIRPPINRARSSTVLSNHQAPIDIPHLRLTTTLPESICTQRASLVPLSTFDIRHQLHIHDNHPSRQIITTLRHSSYLQWNVLYLHRPVP
jgi:hypothetical protein